MGISKQNDAVVSTPAAPARRPVTVRIGRWSATHPWRAIAVWLAFVAGCLLIGQVAGLRSMRSVDGTVGQSGHAARMLQRAGLEPADTENVLITARHGSLDTGLARTAAAAVTSGMAGLPEVTTVAAPVESRDGTAMLVSVRLKNQTTKVDDLMSATAAVQRSYPALRVEQVGDVSMNVAVNDQVSKDLGAAATFSLPVTLLIMLIAFGAIIAAGVPVLLAMSAVAAATGLAGLVSHVIPDSGSTSSMILLMGMAVGVDYSLFFVKRAREERHRGRTHLDAIEIAAETSGHSVLVSGAAVIVAMLGMFMARYTVFSSLAAGSIIVVAVAVLGSLTVLPAILVKLGNRIDRPRVPVLWRWSSQTREPRLWPALLRPAMSHPAWTLAISAGAMMLLALPALGLHLASDTARSLPSSITEVHTLNRLNTAFPSNNTSFDVVVAAPAAAADAVSARLTELSRRLSGDDRFATPTSNTAVRESADRTVHTVQVDAPFDAESAQAHADLAALRSALVPSSFAGMPVAHWAVGGQTAYAVDIDNRLGDAIPWVIGFVVLLTLVITGCAFGSVTLAVSTALLNLLSAAAAFGVLTLTFQHTWAQRLLDFTSTGAVINWIPLFTFAVLFGLSMDYHIFVISRIREAAASGMATRDAVREGITRSAGTVTSAAIVMISVFAIFASLHMVEMKELGFGLAIAVLLDTVVVRVIILPSLMLLLGPWNWWPRGLPRRPQDQATREPVLTRV